ncbi:MAG: phosphoenolpyruvate--protein phosphotransferase [Gammaproteobacteria bacterium]|nr:phosphoenolpyruvate--protein phosphotransferase [Gammaproteobacteria bacterium]
MLTLHGAAVGSGVAIGTAMVLQQPTQEIPQYTLPNDRLENEVQRFRAAVQTARRQLQEILAHIPRDAPTELAGFIDAHLLMLEDPILVDAPVKSIREKRYNAEWALKIHSESLAEVFDNMEDPYLRSKKSDVDQVVGRVQAALLMVDDEHVDRISRRPQGQIVVTHDLTPADTVLLKSHEMKGFVTNLGGPISHTAILARSLRIPAIVGLHGATRYIRNGEQIIVDGIRGVLVIDPSEAVLQEYRTRKQHLINLQHKLEALKSSDAVTRDGHPIRLLANIELPEDIDSAIEVSAAGVGLYRTEYLFMNRKQSPSEAEQFAAYSRVCLALKQPITIRTLDLGADKQVDGGRSGGKIATNPALGLRAVRLCLQHPDLFRPQLRAILRASALGPVEIMIPMVSSLHELDQVLEMIREVKNELERDGLEFDPNLPVGGMIEVPAAAIRADLFARKLDFLSIGTNDLIQYTLAIDRVDDAVNYLYDPLHPSVLRLISMIIEASNAAHIPVSMCGEMAGDTKYTRLLLGLGLRIFSMDPTTLLEVKRIIRESDLDRLRHAAGEILTARDTTELHDMVDAINAEP